MKSAIFRPAAASDVEDAYQWYEHQRRVSVTSFFQLSVLPFNQCWNIRNGFLLFTARCVV